ncbi:phosphotyrosine protein phosphatase [Candidatus Woesearchaeota archaeon]|nr:phosphotyrosine protein phosphatase [Candidatus Woesearchaeota archaeon]
MKILFICNQNKHRSKTAEILSRNQHETRSAGLYNETPVTPSQLEWAELVIVMEEEQRMELMKRFPKNVMQKRIVCLNIDDTYSYGQPALIEQLQCKMDEYYCE